MSKVKIQGNASGTGVLTVTAPNTSTDRTITLPDSTGTILDNTSTLDATKLSGDLPAISGANLTNLPAGGVAGISSSADATAINILSNERVGINKTTPEARLDISAASETALRAVTTVANEYGAIIQTASTNGTPIADFRQNGGSSVVKVTSDGMLVLGKQTTSTATAWNIDVSGATNIGASQNTAIKLGNVTASGMIIVNDTNMTGQLAIYLTGAGAMDIVHQTGSNWATTSSPSTTQASLYQSNGYIYLKSGRGGTMNVSVLTFRTRPQQ